MKRHLISSIALLVLAMGTRLPAQEKQGLELITAQSLQLAEVTASGRVLPLFSARIGSRVSGHVTEWGANEAGQPLDVGMAVKGGKALFIVDPSTFQAHVTGAEAALASAEAAAAELEARLKDREKDADRYERLVKVDQTVPLKRLEEVQLGVESLKQEGVAARARIKEAAAGLQSARIDLRDTVIKAPFDGVITRRMKGLGDYVSGAPLVEVLELTTVDRLEAELHLPEAHFAQVIPGQTRITLSNSVLKADLELPVTRVVPAVEVAQGTFVIRVAIPPDQRDGLVPGMFLNGRLKLAGAADQVLVPLRALLTDGKEPAVMVAAGGKMTRRPVEVGSRLTEGVVIKSGLHAGEQVVVGPAGSLQDGAPLPEALKAQ